MNGRFEILDGFPPDVLAVEGHGRIDSAAYEETLVPALEALVKKEGRAKLFFVLGDGFEGYTAGGAWEDARFGLEHLHDFARIAVVTDADWIRGAVGLMAPLIKGPVKGFHLSDMVAAKAWIAENSPPEQFARVAADHEVTTTRS